MYRANKPTALIKWSKNKFIDYDTGEEVNKNKEKFCEQLDKILAKYSDSSGYGFYIKKEVALAKLMALTTGPENISEVKDYWYQRQFQESITDAELDICKSVVDYIDS